MSDTRKKILLPVAILLTGIVLAVVMIKSRAPVPTRAPREFAPLVQSHLVEFRRHRYTVAAHGSVAPRTESVLVAQVAGQLLSSAPAFASGGFFEKGDMMVRIDPVDYELAVVAARGGVAQARVSAELERARAEVAQEEWDDLGDGTSPKLATRELHVEQADAALAAAEALLRQEHRNLQRTTIRAPYACRVREKLVDVGRYVTPGTPIARVFAIDYVEIRLPIPDAELAYLDLPIDYRGERDDRIGPVVELSADFIGARREWTGRIVRVEGEIDPVTRMVNVVAQVDDPYARIDGRTVLPVGLFVAAEILGIEVENAVVLPRTSLRGTNTVFVIDKDNRLRFREVKVLRTTRDEIIVGAGLEPGERVCITTLEAVTDGMKVRTPSAPATPDATASADEGESGGGR
ncbi:MAG: efflux RND transporter periplasmic adaptor subunit [Candidatus Krumholzibacteriota bacterium]|nr:efflux RND transporter periplasmic adaptor subunit [Candidatus Krumholzibacteriota bacterium]